MTCALCGDETLGQGSFGTWDMPPSASMVDSVSCLCYAECSRVPDHVTDTGFLGRWGTHACPQCLPSDIVPIRSWTRTLRRPGIRHRHLPCHAMPCHRSACSPPPCRRWCSSCPTWQASRSEGVWAGAVRAVHTGPLLTLTRAKEGKVFHEISFFFHGASRSRAKSIALASGARPACALALPSRRGRTHASQRRRRHVQAAQPAGRSHTRRRQKGQFFVRLS